MAALLYLAVAPALGQRSLKQMQQQDAPPQQPPALPELQVDENTKSFVQGALQDVFSAIAYSSGDQQKIAPTTPKPQPGQHLPDIMQHLLYFSW